MEKVSKSQVKLVKSLQQKKYRDELGLFVAEGEKCVQELVKSFELVHLYREGENAGRTEIEQMSGLRTPQGVIAVFKKSLSPKDGLLSLSEAVFEQGDLTLALDGIQDPGNMGTIIRTCDWFGVHDIYCSRDTADCYNPKVVQATMGALARVHVHYVDLPAWLSNIINHQSEIINHKSEIAIYGTLLDGKNMYEVLEEHRSLVHSFNVQPSTLSIIVMGNEGNGISPEVRSLITHPIRIPSYPQDGVSGHSVKKVEAPEVIESLNVSIATAIVLAEFRRP